MWRDPLDELIEELETVVPPQSLQEQHLPRLEDIQMAAHLILSKRRGTELTASQQQFVERVASQMAARVNRARQRTTGEVQAPPARTIRYRPIGGKTNPAV